MVRTIPLLSFSPLYSVSYYLIMFCSLLVYSPFRVLPAASDGYLNVIADLSIP